METTGLTYTVILPTSASDVYGILLDERKHSSFTGAVAIITDVPGSSFSLYDGKYTGKVVQTIKNELIVLDFVLHHPLWHHPSCSEVSFQLKVLAPNETELTVIHKLVPVSCADIMLNNWHQDFWEPLMFYLNR
ncbi:MAG: SRPBCC domain-containing protein [Bacteroidia bacterium]|jgi:activator of HSP90 ATPase|nr:SRPBCC domain-containing protein [Bacteroidia bacterium]